MKHIHFGVVGTSVIAKKFIRACQDIPEITFHSVYSRSTKTGEDFANEMHINKVFTDYKKMLSAKEIDAVYIASPNAYHFEHADLALEYDKHVLCEKPFASNARQLKLLIDKAKKQKLFIMEAMKPLAMPTYKVIRENLDKLGEVRKIVFNFCQYSSKYPAYLRGENPNIFNPKFSTGALMDIGIYCVYPCIDLFGMPKSLQCSAHKLSNGIDGSGNILLEYEDKEAVVVYSKINDSSLGSEIMGEEGSLWIDAISSPTRIELRKKGERVVLLSTDITYDSMYYEAREFVDTVMSNKLESKLYSLDLAYNVMTLLDEVRQQLKVVFPADELC